jgi:cytochrome c-type biogenesis protein CcmH
MIVAWIIAALVAVLFFGALALRNRAIPATFFAACALFALAGYGISGSPALPARTVQPTQKKVTVADSEPTGLLQFADRFAPSARWMAMADSFARRGNTQFASELLLRAAKLYPKDADIWVMQANILMLHSDSAKSPAVGYAFAKAAAINPDAPGLLYAQGIMGLENEDLPATQRAWRRLLQTAPANAPWRPEIESLQKLVDARLASARTTPKSDDIK